MIKHQIFICSSALLLNREVNDYIGEEHVKGRVVISKESLIIPRSASSPTSQLSVTIWTENIHEEVKDE